MLQETLIPRRDPSVVMRLKRLGSLHQCRLSFMRTLTRRMAREGWQFSRPRFEFDEKGVGVAVYSATGPHRTYSLVAFAHDLPDEMRSDRVIATAWDATFTLFDGIPDDQDIGRLSQNIPYQEAGRVTERELSVSRANRSVRMWGHVVDSLAKGRQPDADKVAAIGYLMRTTAVYGSGKLGAADWEAIADREEMAAPFQAEMLSVFLTRAFVRDLVHYMAKQQGGDAAVDLDPSVARQLGIGNSTGLGMAPYIVNHPVLFNNWILAREEAIARVRSVHRASAAEVSKFFAVLNRCGILIRDWHSEHPIQIEKLAGLRSDLQDLETYLKTADLTEDYPWNTVMAWAESHLDDEAQELLASLILEPHGELIDDLADCMADRNAAASWIDGAMSIGSARDLLNSRFEWAKDLDWDRRDNCARAWYVSEEKLEPRLGERFEEPISEYEQPLAPARDAVAALRDLDAWDGALPLSGFLLEYPEHRQAIRRAQISAIAPYGEIHDNTISAVMQPIDMLRAKLSFFGATRFDPRSDRWVRICMYAGAPYPEELNTENCDLWVYPEAAP